MWNTLWCINHKAKSSLGLKFRKNKYLAVFMAARGFLTSIYTRNMFLNWWHQTSIRISHISSKYSVIFYDAEKLKGIFFYLWQECNILDFGKKMFNEMSRITKGKVEFYLVAYFSTYMVAHLTLGGKQQ